MLGKLLNTKIFLIFFASLWMFAIGVFIGRTTAPIDVAAPVTVISSDALKTSSQPLSSGNYKIIVPPGLSNPAPSVKKDLPTATDDRPRLEKPENQNFKTDDKMAESTIKAQDLYVDKTEPFDNTVEVKSGAKTRAEATQSSNAGQIDDLNRSQKPFASPVFAVQVVALHDLGKAESIARDYFRRGHLSKVVSSVDKAGRIWHRVQIGSFDHINQAQELAATLKAAGTPCFVVKQEEKQ